MVSYYKRALAGECMLDGLTGEFVRPNRGFAVTVRQTSVRYDNPTVNATAGAASLPDRARHSVHVAARLRWSSSRSLGLGAPARSSSM